MMSPITTDRRVPNLALPSLEGGPQPLLSNGWTLVCFFKSECPTSPLVLPYVERIHEAYGGADGLRVLGISQDPRADTEVFSAQTGLTFPILLDEGWPASVTFDLVAVPALFLLDATGTVLAEQAGLNKAWLNDLAAQIADHLGRAPLEIAPEGDGRPVFRPG